MNCFEYRDMSCIAVYRDIIIKFLPMPSPNENMSQRHKYLMLFLRVNLCIQPLSERLGWSLTFEAQSENATNVSLPLLHFPPHGE